MVCESEKIIEILISKSIVKWSSISHFSIKFANPHVESCFELLRVEFVDSDASYHSNLDTKRLIVFFKNESSVQTTSYFNGVS